MRLFGRRDDERRDQRQQREARSQREREAAQRQTERDEQRTMKRGGDENLGRPANPERRLRSSQVDPNRSQEREVIGLEGPARPGTPETGKPSMARFDQDDPVERTLRQRTRDRPTGPAYEEHGREDRKEFTEQRAQSDDRRGITQTDTQGTRFGAGRSDMEREIPIEQEDEGDVERASGSRRARTDQERA